MECAYCGLKLGEYWSFASWSSGAKMFFCDESCLHAYNRDLSRPIFTERIESRKDAHIKSDMNEWTKLIVRLFQLERLFYAGCLKRQTKQQLQLLLQRLNNHAQIMFVYADEHKEEFSDGDYLIAADYCGKEYQQRFEIMCLSWCAP